MSERAEEYPRSSMERAGHHRCLGRTRVGLSELPCLADRTTTRMGQKSFFVRVNGGAGLFLKS
ncbi:hypothetical protein LIA77_02179 [Sarocladium implicatum]|nr:hypothetical protein LIA77_02179 [Sarocladium implicatum]